MAAKAKAGKIEKGDEEQSGSGSGCVAGVEGRKTTQRTEQDLRQDVCGFLERGSEFYRGYSLARPVQGRHYLHCSAAALAYRSSAIAGYRP